MEWRELGWDLITCVAASFYTLWAMWCEVRAPRRNHAVAADVAWAVEVSPGLNKKRRELIRAYPLGPPPNLAEL